MRFDAAHHLLVHGAAPLRRLRIGCVSFQPAPLHSHFQVTHNGTRLPNFEDTINQLDQTGPIGKLITVEPLREYWPILRAGTVDLLIDDPRVEVSLAKR